MPVVAVAVARGVVERAVRDGSVAVDLALRDDLDLPADGLVVEARRVAPADYARVYREFVRARTDVGMAYGRVSVSPDSFLTEAVITVLRRRDEGRSSADTLNSFSITPASTPALARWPACGLVTREARRLP